MTRNESHNIHSGTLSIVGSFLIYLSKLVPTAAGDVTANGVNVLTNLGCMACAFQTIGRMMFCGQFVCVLPSIVFEASSYFNCIPHN